MRDKITMILVIICIILLGVQNVFQYQKVKELEAISSMLLDDLKEESADNHEMTMEILKYHYNCKSK